MESTTMKTYAIEQYAIVKSAPDYEVIVGGLYEMFDYVPCRRIIETNGATCAFLTISVIGADIIEGE